MTDPQGYDVLTRGHACLAAIWPEADSPAQSDRCNWQDSRPNVASRWNGGATMIAATRNYVAEVWEAWNEFWFTPTSPTTLSAIRVLAGAMLLYTHLVWSFGLTDFFGHERLAAAAD